MLNSSAIIANPRSDRIKAVRVLGGRSARRKTGKYLVEGPQAAREAVRFEPEAVADIFITPEAADRYVEIVAEAHRRDLRVVLASTEVITSISSDAQGIVVVMHASAWPLDAVVTKRSTLVAVLSNARDPGNVGTVIRAADASGADGVVLAGDSVELHNPKLIRSSVGSVFHLPVVGSGTDTDLVSVTASLRAAGFMICAADGRGDHDLDSLLDSAGQSIEGVPDLARPTAWLFGNEAWGLTDDDLRCADFIVRIPLRGHAESLNLAMAATLCLYASSRSQRPVPGAQRTAPDAQ